MATTSANIGVGGVLSDQGGRLLCIACDHGLLTDPNRSWLHIDRVIEGAVQGRADALLLSLGQIRRFQVLLRHANAPALIVRTDWTNLLRLWTRSRSPRPTLPVESVQYQRLLTAQEALVDASASAAIGFILVDSLGQLEWRTIQAAGELVAECRAVGLPCLLEILPILSGDDDAASLVRRGAWIAAELGADAIKAPYLGDAADFGALRREVDRPIFVLGGGSLPDEDAFMDLMREALAAGADGLIIGRNVSRSAYPERMIARLRTLAHSMEAAAV